MCHPTTLEIGEEDRFETTAAVGEEDCTSHPHNEEELPGFEPTTLAVGEEGPQDAVATVENPFGGF